MMYPYLTLDDTTEIVHSEMQPDGYVKVYIEKADKKDGFHSAYCILPKYEWKDVSGFTENEINEFQKLLENNAHLILELSQNGGINNASSF